MHSSHCLAVSICHTVTVIITTRTRKGCPSVTVALMPFFRFTHCVTPILSAPLVLQPLRELLQVSWGLDLVAEALTSAAAATAVQRESVASRVEVEVEVAAEFQVGLQLQVEAVVGSTAWQWQLAGYLELQVQVQCSAAGGSGASSSCVTEEEGRSGQTRSARQDGRSAAQPEGVGVGLNGCGLQALHGMSARFRSRPGLSSVQLMQAERAERPDVWVAAGCVTFPLSRAAS